MNDRQLVEAFRSLDGPALPEPAFADALFATLRVERSPRRGVRLVVLAAAALLLAAALGAAMLAGSERDQPRPLENAVVPSVKPLAASPAPSALETPTEVKDPVLPAQLPAGDPAPLRLLAADGTAVEHEVVQLPDPSLDPSLLSLTATEDALWAWIGVRAGDRAYLLRIDGSTGEMTRIPDDGNGRPGTVDGETLSWPDMSLGNGSTVGVDEFGRWITRPFGITLVDPATGDVIREFETLEGEGHAYRRIWHPPAMGSLWDLDRGLGLVRRIDPATGLVTAEIPIGLAGDHECGPGDLTPLEGVAGLPDVMVATCRDGAVLVDPETNRFLRVVPGASGLGFVLDGAWLSVNGEAEGQGPDGLVRFDPEGGPPRQLFRLSHEGVAIGQPLVAGDALWLRLGRHRPDGLLSDPALLRVPVAALGLDAPGP